jgi:hypothetical protein
VLESRADEDRDIRRACARFFGALDAVQVAAEKDSAEPGADSGAIYAAYIAGIARLTESLHRERPGSERSNPRADLRKALADLRRMAARAWHRHGASTTDVYSKIAGRSRCWPRLAPPCRHPEREPALALGSQAPAARQAPPSPAKAGSPRVRPERQSPPRDSYDRGGVYQCSEPCAARHPALTVTSLDFPLRQETLLYVAPSGTSPGCFPTRS